MITQISTIDYMTFILAFRLLMIALRLLVTYSFVISQRFPYNLIVINSRGMSAYECIKIMFVLHYFAIYSIVSMYHIESFFNIFTRSGSIQLKERCGHSILLNNNYWLLKQTQQALKSVQKKQITLDSLPWNRLSNSIRQIYNACLVDDMRNSKERMYIHQTAIKASVLLAKKTKDIDHPTLINIRKTAQAG